MAAQSQGAPTGRSHGATCACTACPMVAPTVCWRAQQQPRLQGAAAARLRQPAALLPAPRSSAHSAGHGVEEAGRVPVRSSEGLCV